MVPSSRCCHCLRGSSSRCILSWDVAIHSCELNVAVVLLNAFVSGIRFGSHVSHPSTPAIECVIGIQIVLIPFFLVVCFSGSFRTSFLSPCCRLIINILAIDSGSSWPCQSLVSLYCPHGFSHHSCNRCIAVFRRGYLFVRFIPDLVLALL
jgi:hypothetical protein